MRDDWADLNRRWWDERAPVHVASDFYDVAGFLADPGASTLRPFEIDDVGDVAGRSLVHPQCHFGLDTLSWARRGARAVGLDFSAPAVEAARDLARRAALDAEFVAGDVYDAVDLVGGRTFDVVYTGLGAITWLPDIVELLREHDHTLFPRWPFLVQRDGAYRMPEGMPSLPLMYSLRARKGG